MAWAITGNKEIGRDTGYGRPRYLEPGQVKEVSEALEKITVENLENRFDLDAMLKEQIYCVNNREDLDYLTCYYKRVVDFYKETAEKGYGMLIYLA